MTDRPILGFLDQNALKGIGKEKSFQKTEENSPKQEEVLPLTEEDKALQPEEEEEEALDEVSDRRLRWLERSHQKQGELFEMDTRFLIVLSGLITDGTMAELKPPAVATWLVLRAYSNWDTGRVSLSHETIAELSGQSETTVKRTIKTLEKHGLIKTLTKKRGLRGIYKLVDPLKVFQKDEKDLEVRKQVGTVDVPFKATETSNVLKMLEKLVHTGQVPSGLAKKGVVLNLTVNLTQVQNAQGGQVIVNVNGEQLEGEGRALWKDFLKSQTTENEQQTLQETIEANWGNK